MTHVEATNDLPATVAPPELPPLFGADAFHPSRLGTAAVARAYAAR